MKLRFAADVRTLIWAFVLFPAAVALAYAAPRPWLPWVLPLSLHTHEAPPRCADFGVATA